MFTRADDVNGVEAICYDQKHQKKVLEVITSEFEKVFPKFIETEAGQLISENEFLQLQGMFKVFVDKKRIVKDRKANFTAVILKSIEEFKKDRQKYIDLLDPELLEEDDDYPSFKNKTLKNECPIIHSTLFSQIEELKEYKIKFNAAAPKDLYDVVSNLSQFSRDYYSSYDETAYQNITSYEELGLSVLETSGDTYTAYGVIGGGIRSHILYKNHPECFPNRSQWALWALWFLSNNETFGCEMESEFLMIDLKQNITQQNYFYPYDLFTFYAYHIYKLLNNKAAELGVEIDPAYKYVVVNEFLNYVTNLHAEDISLLRRQIPNGGLGYV